MNLTLVHLGGLAQIFSEEKVAVFNPFCLKSNFVNFGGDAEVTTLTSQASISVPVICNLHFDFNQPSFTILFAEDNFKTYLFSDKFQSNLFSARFYIPPRV